MKLRPHSPATADARSVLPQPGNPYSSSPERRRSGHLAKRGAYVVGYCSVSSSVCLVSRRPPIEANVVVDECRVTPRNEAGVKPFRAEVKSSQ